MIQGSMSRLLLAIVLLLTSTVSAVAAHAASLNPGDLLVAAQGLPGTIHHFSATGTDLGAFVTNNLQSFGWITIDANGDVYVSEVKLDIFSASGTQLMQIDTGFGPGGVGIDSDGSIYVAAGDRGVDKFSASGQFLGKFTTVGADFIAFDASGNLYATYWPAGAIYRISPDGTGELFAGLAGAEGITFDSAGNVYVSSYSLNVIKKFSPSGADLGVFASAGLDQPYGLAFDADGNLYVANWGEGTVRKFSSTGETRGVFASGLVRPRALVIVPGPTAKSHCKDGGWESFAFPRTFKNEGDCIQFVNTGK